MRRHLLLFAAVPLLHIFSEARVGLAITAHQLDDFEGGTEMGWIEGFGSPNPPANVATGGPGGAGDNYVENVSSGVFGSGGNMVMFNQTQWAGDYTTAKVAGIIADMANFGPSTLSMRIALGKAPIGPPASWYAATSDFDLSVDGVWRRVFYGLTSADLVRVNGSAALADVLAGVTDLRILSATAPDFRGATIVGRLGVDNIRAVLLADMDVDGDVDFDDIAPYVLGLNAPAQYQASFGFPSRLQGDIDRDGDQDFDDIPGFVSLLVGDQHAVPEPTSATLVVIASFALMAMRQRTVR